MAQPYDVVIVGGGILGLATARRMLLDRPGIRLAVLEKEPTLARHQTGHNSGVIHSGIYYTPGSLKARLCVAGKRLLEAYADERGIPRETRGKLIVALNDAELGRLSELERRGRANGVAGLRVLDAPALREVEPNVRGVRALHAPETGVIDYRCIAESFAADIWNAGGTIELGQSVLDIVTRSTGVDIETPGAAVRARAVVVCAGLQSDRLARRSEPDGGHPRIVPFRGDYYTLGKRASRLVNGLVYPVPDPSFPFLGVHLTKRMDGIVVAGPNAVLSLAREGYGRASFSLRDAASTLAYPGFWRFATRHRRTGFAEFWRDLSQRAFLRDIQRYVPAITADDIQFGPSGVRAQALGRDGRLVDDFVFSSTERVLHVINAPSPAATSSLAIGAHISKLATERLL